MLDPCSPFSVRFFSRWTARSQAARAVLVSALACLLVAQPTFAELPAAKPVPATASAEIQGRQRILHALNRFTFGPRPGDVISIEKSGLDRWFDLQLNPSVIDDSALDARLAGYPAMQLSVSDLVQKYPTPVMIRGMANGRFGLPQDPAARTLAQDQIAFYKQWIAARTLNQKAPEASTPMPATEANPEPEKINQAMTHDASAAIDSSTVVASEPYSREAVQRLLALPADQRFAALFAMPPAQLVSLRKALRGPAAQRLAAGMNPQQREALAALGGSNRMIASEEMKARVLRDVYSQRQLQAVMTDFWLNHFNVYVRKNQNQPYLIPAFERTVRANALGNFEDLLVATAESPAMLEYLDNFRSIGPDSQAARRVDLARQRNPNGPLVKNAIAGLNENYARELMELHTLGVDGGYTQADVTQVARVFTGWTVDKPFQGGDFQFDERRHEPGSKLVLGKKIKENGQKEGLEVLHMLATSPATARSISQQLAVRFVSDDPPPDLVDRMAATFLSTHGDIRAVLRTLFHSPGFWSSTTVSAKIKTPEEFVFSAARAGNVQIEDPGSLVQSLQRLGMPLYGMQTPNGYSWKKDSWVGTGALVSRMNFALVLSSDRLPGAVTDWPFLLGESTHENSSPQSQTRSLPVSPQPETDAQKELRLELALLNGPVSARTRATVIAQASDRAITRQADQQLNLNAAQQLNLNAGQQNIPGHADKNHAGAEQDPAAAVMAGLLLGSPEFQRR